MSERPEAALARRYGAFFETLTRERIGEVRALVTPDMRFKDPFNDLRGVEQVERLLAKMFDDVDEVRFVMREIVGTEAVWFLHWDFTCRPRRFAGGKAWPIPGVSRIVLDQTQGRVAEHVDYWDAGEYLYERLPLIGSLIRLIKRPLTLSP